MAKYEQGGLRVMTVIVIGGATECGASGRALVGIGSVWWSDAVAYLANFVLVKHCGNGLDRGLFLLLTTSERVKE